MRRRKTMPAAETAALAREYRRTGDDRLVWRIVNGNRGLAISYVQQFSGFEMLPHDDLHQQADLALVEAARRYDPDHAGKSGRTATFSTYAWQWLNAHVLGYIVQNDSSLTTGRSGNLSKTFFGISRAEKALVARGEEVTHEALAAELGVDVEIVTALKMSRTCISLDEPVTTTNDGPSTLTIGDVIADSQAVDPGRSIEQRELREMMGELLRTLKPEERFVIEARYSDDYQPTFTELGRRLNVSRETVRLVENRALAKMRGALERPPARLAA